MNDDQLLFALQKVLAPGQLEQEAQLVARLDALTLDREVFAILWEGVANAVDLANPQVLHILEPELRLLLRIIYFIFSFGRGRPFPGDAYQNLVYYEDPNGIDTEAVAAQTVSRKKFFFGFAYVLSHYLRERYETLRYSQSGLIPSAHYSEVIDAFVKGIGALNFVSFILFRKYRTPLERVFRLRLKVAEASASRALNFEMLNRQLVWEGFTQLLMCLIPIVQSPIIRRLVGRKIMPQLSRLVSNKEKRYLASDARECQICGSSRPCMPHILVPCEHLFCYVCVAMTMHADQSNRCPFCGRDADHLQRVALNAMID
jgi:peroxin-2